MTDEIWARMTQEDGGAHASTTRTVVAAVYAGQDDINRVSDAACR